MAGSCVVDCDYRHLGIQHIHDLEKRINLSMTVSPGDLMCLVCPDRHAFPMLGRAGQPGRPAVIFATDQNFPAMLPASKMGQCAMVVRVEEGSLVEIRCTVRDLLSRFLPPAGTLPGGSVVLTGSVAHMGRVGLTQYAEDLVRHLGAMEAELGSAVSVVPYVPVLAAACCKPGSIADLFDLDSWLVAGGLGRDRMLDRAREAWWGLVGVGGGGRFTMHKRTLSRLTPETLAATGLSTMKPNCPPNFPRLIRILKK